MAAAVNKAAKAPGTVTVGVDAKGKHYKYETGKGRGRQPLNLSPRQGAVLRARGLRPGSTIKLDLATATQLGISSKQSPGAQRYAGRAPTQRSSNAGKMLASKVLASHAKWMQQPGRGKNSTAQRLKLLLANGRAEALAQAGSKPSEAHRALAGAILGTIFSKKLRTGGAKGEGDGKGFKIKFAPGGAGTPGHITLTSHAGEQIASVSFKNLYNITPAHVDTIRKHFDSAVKQYHEPKFKLTGDVDTPDKQKLREWRDKINSALPQAKLTGPVVNPDDKRTKQLVHTLKELDEPRLMSHSEYRAAKDRGDKETATDSLNASRNQLELKGMSVHGKRVKGKRQYFVYKHYKSGGDKTPLSKGYDTPEEATLSFVKDGKHKQ